MGFGRSPSQHPHLYPGTRGPGSYLLIGGWPYPATTTKDANVDDWTIDGNQGPVPLGLNGLDAALSNLGATTMAYRHAIVAVGSNAAPGQLLHKYRADVHNTIIPITRAKVHGLAVAHSGHVSIPGYVPYVPTLTRAAHPIRLDILWLDDKQLRRMDETEPNYQRIHVPTTAATAELESDTTLTSFQVYRGRWGLLRTAADAPPLAATSQEGAYSTLAMHRWFRGLVPEFLEGGTEAAARALAQDQRRRDEIRYELAARNLTAADQLSTDGTR